MSDVQILLLNQQLNKHTNHVLHFLLSACSLGAWLPVWILCSVSNAIERGKAKRQLRAL